jgi:hypothetical protein
MDLQKWRPWLLVIEATLPNSRDTAHDTWEHLVTPHGYQFAYFDGLNRYYVAQEHPELLAALTVQANVFDDYIFHHLDKAWRRATAADLAASESENRLAEIDAELAQARALLDDAHQQTAAVQAQYDVVEAALREAERASKIVQDHADAAEISRRETAAWALQLEGQLNATYASTSWKITKPLRVVGHYGKPAVFLPLLRGALRRVLVSLAKKPAVRRVVLAVLTRFPALDKLAMGWYSRLRGTSHLAPVQPGVPPAQAMMPQSARRVLADLQRSRSSS